MPRFLFDAPDAYGIVEEVPAGTLGVELAAALDGAERSCRFTGRCAGPLAGELSFWFGGICIARFGPDAPDSDITVPMPKLFGLSHLHFTVQGLEAQGAAVAVDGTGNIFTILELDDEDGIVRHIQHTPTRFRERKLLRLAAKHVYNAKADDFLLRAMAIVILGYRLLDDPKSEYTPQDRAELEWILGECRVLVPQGTEILADPARKDWRVYRWTLSVAKMSGYLAISVEDYALASDLFGFANAHLEWVATIPASGANIATMTCLNGMLLLFLGRREEGLASLTLCVERMTWLIAQQHLWYSVSSYSESREIVRTGCQAFTLLSLAGGLPPGNRKPQLHNRRFDLKEVWPSLVHKMILGGRCTALKAFLIEAGFAHEADLTPPPKRVPAPQPAG